MKVSAIASKVPDLRLELGLDGGEGRRVLGIVLVGVAFAECAFLRLLFAAADVQQLGLERRGGGGADGGGARGCGRTTQRNGGTLVATRDGASPPKECQLDLFADRTSTATMRTNQLRLVCIDGLCALCALRRITLHHTPFSQATCGTRRAVRIAILARRTLCARAHRS